MRNDSQRGAGSWCCSGPAAPLDECASQTPRTTDSDRGAPPSQGSAAKHKQSGTRQSCTDNTITYTFSGTQLHCYCTVIPLGFAGCCAGLGRTYRALIWMCMQSWNLNYNTDAPQQCSETHSITARRITYNSPGKQFTHNFGLFYTKGYKFSPFSDPPIKQMTYPFPSESGCSGDRSCSRRQQ